jgi:hypothetical protein
MPTAPSSHDSKARRRGSDEEGCDERLGDTELAHGQLERPVQGANQELEECLLRRLTLLKGDEEACAGALGDAELADGQELEERPIAQETASLEADEEGCTEALDSRRRAPRWPARGTGRWLRPGPRRKAHRTTKPCSKGDEEGWAEARGDTRVQEAQLEGPADGSDEALKEGPPLRLALLQDDEEGWAATLGDPELAHGELEGPVEDSDQGLEAVALRKLALLGRRPRGLCQH